VFNSDQIIAALVRYQLLEPMVSQLLLDGVLQTISLTQQELFLALMGERTQSLPQNFDEFLLQWCQANQMTPDYFHSVFLRELQLQKFKHIQFGSRVESEFLRLKSELDQVEFSLIQLPDLDLAQELYFQLRDDGADFAQLAQEYAPGQEQATGGWIGPVPLSSLPEAIRLLFQNETIGVVYGPVPIKEGFWLVRLERFLAARLTEATRTQLIQRLYDDWLNTQVASVVNTPNSISVLSQEMA
jgi:parvulin-like peptidyl-prolyl isomerase